MWQSVFLLLIAAVGIVVAQPRGGGEANPGMQTNPESLKRWQDMRFGMFIHWGPVTLRGTEIGWSRGMQVPIQDYDSLYREFNPSLFDAREWVGLAKAAGMKYLVITSKHHDGFCLWNSKYTDYSIAATPFHRDVLKELSDECAGQGIAFCTYYSILDWHHPHYTTRYGGDSRPVETSDMNIYRSYLKQQIEELVMTYRTNLLWFDGEWEGSWTHEDGMKLYADARKLNDALLINNRVDKGRAGMKGMTVSGKFAGDFGTPEQEVGAFDNANPWESCITIGNQWSWKPNDRMKSLKECIQILAKTAGGGGNLLLNISPMPDGRIERRQAERLKGIGAWLARYGESIYGTRGGPYKPTRWLASTHKGNRIYVHVLRAPKDELRLPMLPGRTIREARSLGGAKLSMRVDGGSVVIAFPRVPADENDDVIALELDGPAEGVDALEVPQDLFIEVDDGDIRLATKPGPSYPARGVQSLVDGVRGSMDIADGEWMGFEHDDFTAVVDMRKSRTISKVIVGCLQKQDSWIFMPKSIEVCVSDSGKEFKLAGRIDIGGQKRDGEVRARDMNISLGAVKARYVKISAMNVGTCPDWHPGAGGKAWLFIDEIVLE